MVLDVSGFSMKLHVSSLLVGLLFFWAGCAHADDAVAMPVAYGALQALPTGAATDELAYGPAPLQTLLRFDPIERVQADLVFIHGGCWSADYDRAHTLPMAAALRDAGYRVWLPEYRRVGDVGGGWPGTWDDIRRALHAVRVATEAEYPLLAVGHSAGGHLALLAATDAELNIDGAVGLAPITDLAAYAAAEGSCPAMTERLMGGSAEAMPALYAAVSPARLSLLVPTAVVWGDADPIVPVAQIEALAASKRYTVPGAGHFDLVHPGTVALAVVLDALRAVTP